MNIDIQPGSRNQWFVVAHTEFGVVHDVFGSQAEALDFAKAFYGGQVIETVELAA